MSRGKPYGAKRATKQTRKNEQAEPASLLCEADVAEGLEAVARGELRERFGDRVRLRASPDLYQGRGSVRFDYTGDPGALLDLRTVLAVYWVRRFAIPRPRAFLGDEHFRALLAQIAAVRRLAPPDAYQTFYLSAAGSESSVMRRLKEALARHTGLREASHEGDLLLRLRRSPERDGGWEALVRLSPRPLATRAWRVCNMEGALNATVAHAMICLTRPQPDDVFLNIACGSGTLLVERLAWGPLRQAMGVDLSRKALACARANLAAAGYQAGVSLHAGDARALPLRRQSVDVLCADLPFGHLVGSHEENVALYPLILGEAARVARAGARFVLITHEVHLTEALLARSENWIVQDVLRVLLGGLHPRIFVLRRA